VRPAENVRIRWFRWFLLYPRLCIAAAGYAVMAVFAVGYGAAWLIGLPIAHAVVAGVVAIAPIIIAVIGERVTGIKAFGVELNLAVVSAQLPETVALSLPTCRRSWVRAASSPPLSNPP
jgi:hypothetical protein